MSQNGVLHVNQDSNVVTQFARSRDHSLASSREEAKHRLICTTGFQTVQSRAVRFSREPEPTASGNSHESRFAGSLHNKASGDQPTEMMWSSHASIAVEAHLSKQRASSARVLVGLAPRIT